MWGALIKDKTEISIAVSETTQEWIVWREDLQVIYRPLEIAEAWALDTFLQQKNFSDVCSGLCEWSTEEQVPMQAAQYLQQWIQGGLVVKIY